MLQHPPQVVNLAVDPERRQGRPLPLLPPAAASAPRQSCCPSGSGSSSGGGGRQGGSSRAIHTQQVGSLACSLLQFRVRLQSPGVSTVDLN